MWTLKDLFNPNIDKMKAKKNVKSLIQVLENKMKDNFVRRRAAIALGEIGDVKAVEILSRVLKDRKRDIRQDAIEALGRIGGPSVIIPLLRNLVEEPNDYDRHLSMFAFEKNLNESAVEPLFRALKDESKDVRFKAIEFLGKIGNVKAIEYLKQTLDHEDKNIRISAAVALGKRGDASGIEYLIQALKDEEFFLRREIIVALGIIGDERAIEFLVKPLKDKNLYLHDAAVAALQMMDAPKAREALMQFGGDPIEVKRRREHFCDKFPDIVRRLSEMPIFAEEEYNLALKLNSNIELPLKTKIVSKWGKANKEIIIDILSTVGNYGDYKECNYGGMGPLNCKTVRFSEKPIGSSIKLYIISACTESTERHDGKYTWDSGCSGELYLLRISEKEYRYFFDGTFVAGNVDKSVEFIIPKD